MSFQQDFNAFANGAMGAMKGLGDEVKNMARSSGDRIASELELVSRHEVDALREMLLSLKEEVSQLRSEISGEEATEPQTVNQASSVDDAAGSKKTDAPAGD